MRVIKVLEPIGKEDWDWMKEFQADHTSIEYRDTRGWSNENLAQYVKDAEVIVLTNRPVQREVIELANNLKLILVAFAGIDHIDEKACRERSISIRNAKGYATHAVAELTLCMAICLLRRVKEASVNASQSTLFPLGLELYGKKVGIIGGGSIGLESARLFSQFGCEVVVFHYKPLEIPYVQVSLETLLKDCDLVSLHIPLKEDTFQFLSRDRLLLMKPSAFLINTARGSLVDEDALIDLLKQGKIAGAAVDVLKKEPVEESHPFLRMPNVIVLPHIGYRTKEAALSKAEITISHLRNWIKEFPK